MTQEVKTARFGLLYALLAIGVAREDVDVQVDEAIRPEDPIDPFYHCDVELREILEEGTPLQREACAILLSTANS